MEDRKRKILVIDDTVEVIEITKQILNLKGFEVVTALDGRTGIEKVLSESPELVVLDLKLPDIPGEEILKRIKEIDENIAVIIITGFGSEQLAVDLMKAGAIDFLSKPFEPESFLSAVINALTLRDAEVVDKQQRNYFSLEKFFPFLAHEIRNPLHAIAGAIAVIQRRSNLQDEYLNRSIRIVQEEVQHLNGFVQECLDFVRPPSKEKFNEVDLNQLIPFIINLLSHMFIEFNHKIKIDMEISPDIPKVNANYEEIKKALLNLLKNSFEAMEEGGELVIRTGYHPDKKSVEILFKDNGTGIKKENLRHLFTPFFTTKLRGTGLGLAICKRIIMERHQGRIAITSEEGRGTTVTIQLPVYQAPGIFGGEAP
ncbi:MAG: response regulator [Thermodesulfobacteriota bacterium]|nr:response regulator [Thermodesulfobacteriota bacterium]